MQTLVVLPTLDEGRTVAEVVTGVAATGADVLVVDDASGDGTADVAERAGATVLRRPRGGGLGSAYRDGFAWALAHDYEAVVEMDADLSHDPRALPSLIDALALGADLAIGSRYVSGGTVTSWPWHRRALSRWGNRYSERALRLPLRDATSGYRAYRADALRAVDMSRIGATGYGFQIEMAYRLARLGMHIVEVPITFTERTEGTSKMTTGIVLEALVLVTAWGIRDRLRPGGGRAAMTPAPQADARP